MHMAKVSGTDRVRRADATRIGQLSRLTKRRDERKVAPMNFRAVRISLIITIIPGMVG